MKRLKYKWLEWHKIPVHSTEHVEYVLCKDIDARLSPVAHAKFNEYFGIQTCPVVPEGPAVYPWDAEAVLERIASGKKTGSQLIWD